MQVTTTSFKDILILTPNKFFDERGYFFESFNLQYFNQILAKYNNSQQNITIVQDNQSYSKYGVLRGLHYQIEQAQSKLIRVTKGKILDVVVDIRKHSSTFSKWLSVELSQENNQQLWIPAGFAHGFVALSQEVEVLYKTTNYRYNEFERCILWNDLDLNINWQIDKIKPIISPKDRQGIKFVNAQYYTDFI